MPSDLKRKRSMRRMLAVSAIMGLSLAGCGSYSASTSGALPDRVARPLSQNTGHRMYHVYQTHYDSPSQTVYIYTKRIPHGPLSVATYKSLGSEHTLDMASLHGVVNFATSQYPTSKVSHIIVMNEESPERYGQVANAHKDKPTVNAGGALHLTQGNLAPHRSFEMIAQIPVPSDPIHNAGSSFAPSSQAGADAYGAYGINRTYRSWHPYNSHRYGANDYRGQYGANHGANNQRGSTAGSGTAKSGATTTAPSGHATSGATTTAPSGHATSGATTTAPSSATSVPTSSIPIPPPGVHLDPNIVPAAGVNASYAAKLAAVESVAESKLGTPYIWGHNEDRGQYGFDCSNYTEYVFHHALGYLMTTSSKGQYLYVGVKVPLSAMRPGDLIAFDSGAHVGIFIGNGQMIQEGGGLGKCGYLPLTPTSYWYHHISAVKRMF
ncbi:C40 family peptidase [Ferroacidibacillus organovorans]|uniref:C40 family peptidase n=1 Tax=Ferroacidibacillus organovorans TaxID=1765683 RepID=UPI000AB4F6D3|nr:NlpC/P60 family protein [Ferroacidibacillus organovorans]